MVLTVARLLLVPLCMVIGVMRLEACTCGQRSACTALAHASDVFLGTAQSEEPQSDGSFLTQFRVKETFKGKPDGKAEVISLASIGCGMTRR